MFKLGATLILMLAVLFYNHPMSPTSFSLEAPLEAIGPLEPNDLLDAAEFIGTGILKSPESMQISNAGVLYTGLANGSVVAVDLLTHRISEVAYIGSKDCDGHPSLCGRPLGLELISDELYVLDAYLGLYVVDIRSGLKRVLLDPNIKVNGSPLRFLNFLVRHSNGSIFITQSSLKWDLENYQALAFESLPDGRLLRLDPNNNVVEVANGLVFPNGLLLDSNECSLLLLESIMLRVWRLDLCGSEDSPWSLFASNLPLLPDNIRSSSSGGYWLASGQIRMRGYRDIAVLSKWPILRKLLYLIIPKSVVHAFLMSPDNLVLELSHDGRILRSFRSTSGHLGHLSEALEHNGYLYLGSYRNNYLARFKLP